MRTIIKITGFVTVLALTGIISCSDETAENSELSPAAKQYLSMRLGANNAMSRDMAGPINKSFEGLFSAGVSGGRIKGDSSVSPSPGDSTIIQEPWQSCAVISEIDNEDGSHTTIYDYGDGCEEGYEGYKYFMHGKLTSTYLNNYSEVGTVYHDSYFYSAKYDNYGGNYNGEWAWVMNGGGTYEGESEYDYEAQTFKGNYSYSDETTYTYDSMTYYYKGNGTTRYTENKYIIESSEFEYASGEDYYYKTKVLKQLVMDYQCYSSPALGGVADFCWFFTYVSGRERIQYKEGNISGTFEIDYGDGECDNIITVYEDGKMTVIDLSKDW